MKRLLVVVLIAFLLTSCRGASTTIPEGTMETLEVATTTPEPTPTPPNILDVVRVQVETKAAIEATAQASEATLLATVVAEGNRHTEAVAETISGVAKTGFWAMLGMSLGNSAAEAVDDSSRNWGGAATLALLIFLIGGSIVLARSLGKEE